MRRSSPHFAFLDLELTQVITHLLNPPRLKLRPHFLRPFPQSIDFIPQPRINPRLLLALFLQLVASLPQQLQPFVDTRRARSRCRS
jgi:hypothetical protein